MSTQTTTQEDIERMNALFLQIKFLDCSKARLAFERIVERLPDYQTPKMSLT